MSTLTTITFEGETLERAREALADGIVVHAMHLGDHQGEAANIWDIVLMSRLGSMATALALDYGIGHQDHARYEPTDDEVRALYRVTDILAGVTASVIDDGYGTPEMEAKLVRLRTLMDELEGER